MNYATCSFAFIRQTCHINNEARHVTILAKNNVYILIWKLSVISRKNPNTSGPIKIPAFSLMITIDIAMRIVSGRGANFGSEAKMIVGVKLLRR